jgi:5-oxoprolinase (ATP-hydrolysing)
MSHSRSQPGTTPRLRLNTGCFRPIAVTAPEGSILNCRYPAAVNMRTMTGWYCSPAVFRALAPVLPNQVQAFTGLPMGAGAYGYDQRGRMFNNHLFQGGGQGASGHGDGKSALLYPTSVGNVSVEMFENRTPMLVECKELITDSGGPGRFRGGLGQRVRVRKLHADGRPALVSVHPLGMIVGTSGLFGGHAGRKAFIRMEEPGKVLEGLDVHGLAEVNRPDQVVTVELAGGSGYGNPVDRPLAEVRADLEEGLVSPEGAKAYGVTAGLNGAAAR